MPDPIGMPEMAAVFELTDHLGISREKVEVPLLRAGDGSFRRLGNGKLEITLPEAVDAAAWLAEFAGAIAEAADDLREPHEETP